MTDERVSGTTGHDHTEFVREYLAAIENGVAEADLARFFTPDVIQEEFPNRVTPNGATRDLNAMLEASQRGRKVLTKQTYQIHNIIAAGAQAVVEVTWIGTIAVAFGSLAPGDAMKARFCMVLEFEGGRIRRQRNYDCFDPF